MLNYKNTLAGFILVVTALVTTNFFLPVSFWIFLLPALIFMALLIWGSVSIQSDFYLRSVCHGDRKGNAVSLTFDDGPDALTTPMVLDMLKQNNIKACFFIVGHKGEKHPDILQRIDREGHVIGGHSFSHHFFFDLFAFRRMKQELLRTSDIVYRATGKRIRLFRPPYGVTNPVLARVLKGLRYISVGWSLKLKDAVIRDETRLLGNLTKNLKAGDIVLFHDIRPGVDGLLAAFGEYLRKEGFGVERIDNLLNIEAYDN